MNWVLLIKATSWWLVSIPVTLMISYLYTGKVSGSIGLTAVLTVVLTACQYGYEKLWLRYFEVRIKSSLRLINSHPS